MGTPRLDRLDRNFIINGAMEYWQRVAGNVTTVNTAANVQTFTSDRFFHYSEGPTVKNYSVARNVSVPTVAQAGYAFPFSRRFTCLTTLTSPAAGDRVIPHHYTIEGTDCRLLLGQISTFGFWVNCSLAGTYPVNFMTNGGTRTYMTTFNIGAGEVNTWVFRTFTLQFENNIPTDNGPGIYIRIGGHSGSTFRTATVGAWQAGNFDCTTTSTNIMSVANARMDITGVQLVLGSVLTAGSFSLAGRDLAGELQLCQRYFEKSYEVNTAPGSATASGSTGVRGINGSPYHYTPFCTWKRAAPVIVLYDWAGAANRIRTNGINNVVLNGVIDNQVGSFLVAHNITSGEIFFHWTADAEI